MPGAPALRYGIQPIPSALRAGVDLHTLQRRMDYSDIKTTMEYLHYIEPEQHPWTGFPVEAAGLTPHPQLGFMRARCTACENLAIVLLCKKRGFYPF